MEGRLVRRQPHVPGLAVPRLSAPPCGIREQAAEHEGSPSAAHIYLPYHPCRRHTTAFSLVILNAQTHGAAGAGGGARGGGRHLAAAVVPARPRWTRLPRRQRRRLCGRRRCGSRGCHGSLWAWRPGTLLLQDKCASIGVESEMHRRAVALLLRAAAPQGARFCFLGAVPRRPKSAMPYCIASACGLPAIAGFSKTVRQRAADLLFADAALNRCARTVAWLEYVAGEALDGEHAAPLASSDGVWADTRRRLDAAAAARGFAGRDAGGCDALHRPSRRHTFPGHCLAAAPACFLKASSTNLPCQNPATCPAKNLQPAFPCLPACLQSRW